MKTNKDMPRRGRHSQCRSPRSAEVEQPSQASAAPPVRHPSYHHSHHHPHHAHVAPSARRGGRGRLENQPHENAVYVSGAHAHHRHRGRGPRRRCRWKNPRGHVPDDGSLSESESQESCGYHDNMCLTCGEHLSARHACAQGLGGAAGAVGRGRTSPCMKSEDSGSLGDEELHQAQLAAHRAFEALSRQMKHVSVRYSTTSTDRDHEEMEEDSEDDSTDSFISDMESNLQSEYRKFMTKVSQHLRDKRSKGRFEKRRLKQQKKQLTARTNELDEKEMRLQARENEIEERRQAIEQEKEALNNERAEIERQWQKFHEEMERLEEQNKQQMSRVKLDVGGQIYTTSTMTLLKDTDSMLAAMFSGRHPIKQEEDGTVFIDRDGTHFRYILNYLRDGGFVDGSLPEDKQILKELLNEAVYYQLNDLIKTIQQIINE